MSVYIVNGPRKGTEGEVADERYSEDEKGEPVEEELSVNSKQSGRSADARQTKLRIVIKLRLVMKKTEKTEKNREMQYTITEFETIYLRCFPPAMRLAIGMLHDEDEARDVVQEVFVKLWETETQVDNPLAYIVRSVRNSVLNRIESVDIKERFQRGYSLELSEEGSIADVEARHEAVRKAVEGLLTERERQVVDKIYAEGMTYKQAATSLALSEAMINKSVVGALKKLRTYFKTKKP